MSMSHNSWAPLPPPPGTQPSYAAMAASTPAYTPVQVRQSFNYAPTQAPQFVHVAQYPPLPPVAAPAKPPAKKKIEWPASVRSYVQRAFDPINLYADVPRPDMEAKLKATISSATETDTLTSIDWDNLPLPQEMVRTERAALSQPSPRWVNGRFISSPESQSKKRKSQVLDGKDEQDVSSKPPWRTTNNNTGFEDRITFAPNGGSLNVATKPLPDGLSTKASKSQKSLEKRQRRFDGGYKSTYKESPTPDANSGPVVGRCQTLEKRYFRLTSAPNPDHVRPEPILKQTLDFLKKKWRKESNYSYICDQFKSLRQDLTVQHIRNKFTVEVYEIHARIALEKGDLGEYNQCQTQLRALYAQKLGGNPIEFKAYRILYFIHTCNRTALNDVLADLTIAEKDELAIKHALGVRSALALGNYHRFFRLYLDTPNMGAYLMDMFVERERLAALSNICRAYKPHVKLRFITEELGFESDAEAAQFICAYEGGRELLEERDDGILLLTGKTGGMFDVAKNAAFKKIDIKGQI
ncbi:hypothetical protein V495_05735 [Pseudogymnoascus sp. VKM F-4514 (FW-929)]|nr:hypothetical protein V495_05735 [Pseudogymnoascus sp. VKM F-4514 (FW-929)]KFY58068.1 hypothetical protein V497_05085 [Pseudogymnoascus sp. VKM F-4516 (FW-969)]